MLVYFLLVLQLPLMAHWLPRRVPLCCRLALRWALSAVPSSRREHQSRQREQSWLLLVLLWWVLQVMVLVLVLGHRQCQLESVSMLKASLFQVDHLAGQLDQWVLLLATKHLCCQTALVWVLLVMLSLMMGQLCCQQEPPSPGQVRPVGCNTTTAFTVKLDIGSPMDQNSGRMHHQHDRQVLCRSTLALALEAGWAAAEAEGWAAAEAAGYSAATQRQRMNWCRSSRVIAAPGQQCAGPRYRRLADAAAQPDCKGATREQVQGLPTSSCSPRRRRAWRRLGRWARR